MIMRTRIVYSILLFVLVPCFIFPQEVINIKLDLVDQKLPFGLTKKIPAEKPKVSLVLSGGGSRAMAHVGVIKAIEELSIPIDQIVGTSMGSVIGGLYSAGYSSEELDSLVKAINWEELFFLTSEDRSNLFVDQKITEDKSLVTIRLNGLSPVVPQAINTSHKISNLLTSLTLNSPINQYETYDELLYKFRAVATELITGRRIVIKDGPLSEAMRASSSVSFLLPPIRRGNLLLVDGGIVDNLPINSASELNPDFIIASNATSALLQEDELIYPWDIADQIVSIPSRKVWQESAELADILIDHNLNKRKNNNFNNLGEVIQSGYDKALNQLSDVKDKLDEQFLNRLQEGDKYYKIQLGNEDNVLAKKFKAAYENLDSISLADINFLLYKEYESGNYKDISAKIIKDSISIINFSYELNPIVKNINLFQPMFTDSNALNTTSKYLDELKDKPFNVDNLLTSLLSILRENRKHGNMISNVEHIFFDESTGTLNITLTNGIISNIDIHGNETTLESVIRREFKSIPGYQLKKDVFDQSLISLTATDLFDNVCACFADDTLHMKKLKLNVDEKLPNVLRFGLRIDNENFTQLAVDIRNENLFGTGSEIGLSVAGGTRNMSYILEHKTNRIFDTYLTYKAQAFYKFNDVNQYADDQTEEIKKFSRSRISEYRQRFYGGFIGVGAHLKKIGTLTTEAKYEVNEIDNVYSFPKESEYKLNISSLKFRLQIDSQNRYPYPTKGIYINTYYETAQKILGGDISFAKFSFDYSGFFTIADRHTFNPRIEFGFADETLPLSQQFNFGGQNNFLGYRDYEFRGRQILITSLHYRYKIPINLYFDTYLKISYDLGSSWQTQEQIQFNDLKHGIGLTLSLDTPIGPADFSIGRSLYLKDTSPERILSRGPLMFYFTIGYYY